MAPVDTSPGFVLVTADAAPDGPIQKQFMIANHRFSIGAAFLLALLVAPLTPRAEPASPKPAQQTVLILGDSLAAGYGVDPSEAFPALLQKKADEAGLPALMVNAGVSGDTSAGGLRRLGWLLKRPVDVLVLELGGNDGLRGLSLDMTRTNLQAIIDRTRRTYPKVRVVLVGMQMPPNLGPEYVQSFKELFPNLARKNQAALVPFLLEGVGGRSDLNLPDQIHPTAEGHKILAENVWKILKPVLSTGHESSPP